MRILGIETSCDDTAIAIVEDGCQVLGNVVSSQLEHSVFGGVVPEIAARQHLQNLPQVLEACLRQAETGLDEIVGVGVTRGPGLIGALLSGWCYGRGLARARGLPWVGVHHLAAHIHGALMPSLAAGEEIPYPLLALVVSGGHTALYQLPMAEHFRTLGETRDDAAGEAFDKTAARLELGYPGGPVIDRLAESGDPEAFPLPRSQLGDGLDFSFSGLKTAVRRLVMSRDLRAARPEGSLIRDLLASFQSAAVDMLCDTTARAMDRYPARGLVAAGGVAANRQLRQRLRRLSRRMDVELYLSPTELATDNAAMIAGAAHAPLSRGERDDPGQKALANWPLETVVPRTPHR